MLCADSAFASSSEPDSASRPLQDDVEVHAEDTGEGVILDTQVNVLLDTETKAPSIGEVSLLEFSVLDFEASLEDLIGFVASDSDMDCDFLVSFNAKASDCEPCSGWDWFLASQIFKHFAG